MRTKMIWGLVTLIILIIGAAVVFLMVQPDPEPTVKYKDIEPDISKPPNEPGKVPVAQDVEHDPSFKEEKEVVILLPLPRSSVPDDIPEHLRLPPEWVDGSYSGLEDPKSEHFQGTVEDVQRFMDILKEIIRDYNPQRPLSEIWPQYIANEKMYRAVAEETLGYTPLSAFAFNRIDWMYEQTWAFPEVVDVLMFGEEPPPGEEYKPSTTLRIEMGELEPEWNFIHLKDGRPFFVKGQTRYHFTYQGLTAEGLPWNNTTTFSRADIHNPERTVTIDVANTSDEELKRLGGWDYSINPLTLQPIQYKRYNMKYKE